MLDKTEDVVDGAKALEKINDGNKIDLPPIEAKVSGNVEFVNETFESSNKILALPPPRNTSLSLKEVRRLRGRKKWEAGETYVQELYGSKGQKHYQVPAEGKITGSGGRYVDAPVSVPKNNVIAIEVKTYNKYITVEGNAILNEVPLSSSIKQQVLKDIYLRDNVPGYDPRWIFLDAPPSAELSTFLNKNRIISIIYK